MSDNGLIRFPSATPEDLSITDEILALFKQLNWMNRLRVVQTLQEQAFNETVRFIGRLCASVDHAPSQSPGGIIACGRCGQFLGDTNEILRKMDQGIDD